MHHHVILIAKLIANLLHSITPSVISGMGSLEFGGIFGHAEAVYSVEIDHHCSSSSQQPHKWHLEVTKACNVTFDCQDAFSIVRTPQTNDHLGRTMFPILVLIVFSSWNVHYHKRSNMRHSKNNFYSRMTHK